MTKKASLIKPELKLNGETGQPVTKEKTAKRKKIQSKEVYELTMKEIDVLMRKGEDNLSEPELDRLRILSVAAEDYEDAHDPLPLPSSLQDMIRMRMFQLKLNQYFAAKLLGVSEAKFSLIMNGKQKPDIYFIKAIHTKLNLDAHQILLIV